MKWTLSGEAALIDLGKNIGSRLVGGDCLELVGDVGAGKTTLTKGIARGMGSNEIIQSPTFTISNLYDMPDGLQLVHYDFYRLQDAGIMAHELAETTRDATSVTVVEWSDIVAGVLPEERLRIEIIAPTPDSRQVTLIAHGKRAHAITQEVGHVSTA